MSMTKKDFTLVANVLASSIQATGPEHLNLSKEATIAVATVASIMADAMAEAYPRFDHEKFLDACDIPPEIRAAFPAADG